MRVRLNWILRRLAVAGLPLFLLAGCGSSEGSGARGGAASESATASCAKRKLSLVAAGKLTVATDKPASAPYYHDNDPSNGKGFESALAYAIAQRLGFPRSQVTWTTVPLRSAYAPGPKPFDFDLNEISITPQREKVVDFSTPYYTASQAVIAARGSAAAHAESLAGLRGATFGVQIGTTSLDAVRDVLQPTNDPKVLDNSDDLVSALKTRQVDAVVTDLPAAFSITSAQVPGAKIVGQFKAPGGDSWAALLEKGSKLTPCVDRAVRQLRASGELKRLTDKWMGGAAGAPVLR